MAACARPWSAAGLPAVFAAMLGSFMMNVLMLLFVIMFVTAFWSFFVPATYPLLPPYVFEDGLVMALLEAPEPCELPFFGIVP